MKKIVLVVILVLFFAGSAQAHGIETPYTPRDLETWLIEGFTYDTQRARDPGYDCYAFTLEKFIENKGGTCKDFAYATAQLLESMGYSPQYAYYYDRAQADWHVVTVFEWQGRLYIFDAWLLRGPYNKVEDISRTKVYVREPVDTNLCLWR